MKPIYLQSYISVSASPSLKGAEVFIFAISAAICQTYVVQNFQLTFQSQGGGSKLCPLTVWSIFQLSALEKLHRTRPTRAHRTTSCKLLDLSVGNMLIFDIVAHCQSWGCVAGMCSHHSRSSRFTQQEWAKQFPFLQWGSELLTLSAVESLHHKHQAPTK